MFSICVSHGKVLVAWVELQLSKNHLHCRVRGPEWNLLRTAALLAGAVKREIVAISAPTLGA